MRVLRTGGGALVESAREVSELAPPSGRRSQEVVETAVVVRCPRCRAVLVARMGRRGPCFPCRCTTREN